MATSFEIRSERVTCAGATWPTDAPMPHGLETYLTEAEYRAALIQLQQDGQKFFQKTCRMGCGLYQGICAGIFIEELRRSREKALEPWLEKGLDIDVVAGTKYTGPKLEIRAPSWESRREGGAEGKPKKGRISHRTPMAI